MRQTWIDILKGIGILSVMWVHITGQHGLFIFALPLFFILPGYLYHPQPCLSYYLKKTVKRLLVPYFAFFCLIVFKWLIFADNLTGMLIHSIKLLLWGGTRMYKEMGVFWFAGVLFFALNIFNYMRVKHFNRNWYLAFFLMSHLLFLCDVRLPWNVQSLPLVLSYMYVGFVLQKHWDKGMLKEYTKINKCIIGVR